MSASVPQMSMPFSSVSRVSQSVKPVKLRLPVMFMSPETLRKPLGI